MCIPDLRVVLFWPLLSTQEQPPYLLLTTSGGLRENFTSHTYINPHLLLCNLIGANGPLGSPHPVDWMLILCSNCVNLEKSKKELKQQLKVAEQEAWHLRQSNTKLQLKEDATQGEKEEQQEEMERVLWEKEQL